MKFLYAFGIALLAVIMLVQASAAQEISSADSHTEGVSLIERRNFPGFNKELYEGQGLRASLYRTSAADVYVALVGLRTFCMAKSRTTADFAGLAPTIYFVVNFIPKLNAYMLGTFLWRKLQIKSAFIFNFVVKFVFGLTEHFGTITTFKVNELIESIKIEKQMGEKVQEVKDGETLIGGQPFRLGDATSDTTKTVADIEFQRVFDNFLKLVFVSPYFVAVANAFANDKAAQNMLGVNEGLSLFSSFNMKESSKDRYDGIPFYADAVYTVMERISLGQGLDWVKNLALTQPSFHAVVISTYTIVRKVHTFVDENNKAAPAEATELAKTLAKDVCAEFATLLYAAFKAFGFH
eukprot:Nk52_evm1s2568 gene=Nk52_evmTU1s2568